MGALKAVGLAERDGDREPWEVDRVGNQVDQTPTPNPDDAQRTGCAFIEPHEIAIEFFERSRPLDDRQRDRLRDRGVSDDAVASDPGYEGGPLRAARVVFAAGVFDFADDQDEDAVDAFVVIARDWRGYTADAVAFDSSGRVARWLGSEALLGRQRVLAPRLGDPLRIFRDPGAWLAGGRDGVVALDWRLAAEQLAGVSLLVSAGDVEFARQVDERLTRPAPEIFVEGGAAP